MLQNLASRGALEVQLESVRADAAKAARAEAQFRAEATAARPYTPL